MASFKRMKDVNGWLADHEEFEPNAMKSKIDPSRRHFDLEYDVLLKGFQVSESHTICGVEERYFYLFSFDCGLRFPLSNLILGVFRVYDVAPS